jgi:hypothetical protein
MIVGVAVDDFAAASPLDDDVLPVLELPDAAVVEFDPQPDRTTARVAAAATPVYAEALMG